MAGSVARLVALPWMLLGVQVHYRNPCAKLFHAGVGVTVSILAAWNDPIAYGRTMTPFWILIALEAAARREWLGSLPMALIGPPTGAQFAYYITAFLKSP
jgi:hypothetical protein